METVIFADISNHLKITKACASISLRRAGYSYKNTPSPYVEASEEKRIAYQALIKDIPPPPLQSLLYIDESGIELTMCKV